jgi:hypothetical protein
MKTNETTIEAIQAFLATQGCGGFLRGFSRVGNRALSFTTPANTRAMVQLNKEEGRIAETFFHGVGTVIHDNFLAFQKSWTEEGFEGFTDRAEANRMSPVDIRKNLQLLIDMAEQLLAKNDETLLGLGGNQADEVRAAARLLDVTLYSLGNDPTM